MITKQIENTKVTLYTDAEEYAKDFFDIPEGAILDTNNLTESAGFSSIDDDEIWIFKGKNCSFEELLSTVAHELGHLIEGGYKKNPPQIKRYDSRHELKAIHYENFVIKSHRIATVLFNEC
jgi:Zn-dependent peptidase ImmA (M78 family)